MENLQDKYFKEMCEDIINNGFSTEGELVRPHWEDGSPAHTYKRFGVVHEYDLREQFPLLSLRPVPMKSCIDELLWIWQKKSNNINDLNSKIWNSWADEKGSIGKAYGYQIGKRHVVKTINHADMEYSEYKKIIEGYQEYPSCVVDEFDSMITKIQLDQIDSVLYDLKHTPFSRRMVTEIFNHSDLHEMRLQPCAHMCTFNVTDEGGDRLVLNMIMNQRSQDTLTANAWNVAQYAMLLKMIAQVSNMEAGKFLHVIADAHIYDRHIDIVKDLIERESFEPAIVELDPDIKNFYDFTTDSFRVINYKHGEQIRNIPVAV